MLRNLLLLLLPSLNLAAAPLALHKTVQTAPSSSSVITLLGYDTDGDSLTAVVTSLPATGTLYHLTDVFSKYGYEPKQGTILNVGDAITDPKNRLLYVRPTPDRSLNEEWGRFQFTMSDGTTTSQAATVVLLDDSGVIKGSYFNSDAEGWTTENNVGSSVSYEASGRGGVNHYIHSTDDTLDIGATGHDQSLWRFRAPSKFEGLQGALYKGKLEFTLSSFSGDFSASNLNSDTNLVELFCSSCATNTGITIAYPLSATSFDGSTKSFSIDVVETAGWLQDPENTLSAWTAPTKCQFIEVLQGLSSVTILGDFTKWYESVSVDNVKFRVSGAVKSNVPICAQGVPDASTCTCP